MVKAYRAYRRAYKKAYKRGNALLLGKTVNQKYKVELFKRKNEFKNAPVHKRKCNQLT